MHQALLALVPALAIAAACGGTAAPKAARQQPAAPAQGPGSAGPAAAAPAGPPLPEGVLARETGTQGVIEVIEREGLRQLVIAGAVHAAVPIAGAAHAAVRKDAMVGVLRKVRPEARTALVIGLGSGGTATELAAAGLDVLAIELEPKVIELARRWFGFRGKAEAGDGLAFVGRDQRRWDVILVDALSPVGLPAPFLEDPAIEALRARLAEGGVLAVRMVERPDALAARAFIDRIGDYRSHLALGSGVGNEQQNLYLLDSDRPMSLAADPALPVWPLIVPGYTGQPVPYAREVTVMGYLVRVGPQRTLCLDLLHWEMGAVRFVLGGAAAAELERLAPPRESPSSGDIGTDGDIKDTLAASLGGAHFKRSDIRYSPTIVALKGTASFREAIQADDLERLRAQRPPLLPWGGVLYDLAIASVEWKLELAAWRALRKGKLDPQVRRLHAAARAGDLRAAYQAAKAYVAALDAALGAWAEKFEVHRQMSYVQDMLILHLDGKPTRAAACARAAERIDRLPRAGYFQNPDVDPVPAQLRLCAKRR